MPNHFPSLLIIGNCIVDQIWKIDQFPEEDSEFRALSRLQQLGGNACNTAQMLSKLGHEVELVAQLADDADARWVLQQLQRQGIQTSHCPVTTGSTTPLSSIWLNNHNGSRTICHYRGLPELSLTQLYKIKLDSCQWIHFEGRNISVLQQYLPRLKKQIRVPVSLEIEKHRAGVVALLPYVDVVIISHDYLNQTRQSAENCMRRFNEINPALQMACTLGDQGLIASKNGKDMIKMDAESVERVVDSIGAGDCFIAGLISQLSQRIAFEQALSYANRLAASKLTVQGMGFRPEDIDD